MITVTAIAVTLVLCVIAELRHGWGGSITRSDDDAPQSDD